MADKKTKTNEAERKVQPTVQHESSANNAQDIGIRGNSQSNQAVNSSHRKRKNNGSDGADQERGSNH